jgi:eukaryotic-like serine/threonine-protein kinase
VIDRKRLTIPRALAILDGVAAGLEAMHHEGLAHLDVKPSNVILPREGRERPVLVDFGLAGRTVRPGCATLEYGAPEVWGMIEPARASAVDVYAFGALAYEVLTGQTLFTANEEAALLVAHGVHDGGPDIIKGLPIADVLSSALRRDPNKRASIGEIRKRLAAVDLSKHNWPLSR